MPSLWVGTAGWYVAAAMFEVAFLGTLSGAEPDIAREALPRVPASEPRDALAKFQVKDGFELQLAASEPEVMDPVAVAFDENGGLYVVEMRGYSERRDARMGRVRLLRDADADGIYEQSTVFAQDLAWPTAVTCWDGGVFVGASPDIWYMRDHDGDGVSDERRVVFTGFGHDVTRLNVQALLNSFHWGPDQRIHGVTSFNGGQIRTVTPDRSRNGPVNLRGRDFSFDPRTLDFRPESGGGQHGMSFDSWGRKFVCSNSRHLMQVMYEDALAARPELAWALPSPAVDIAVDGPAAEVFRLSPDEPWRIVRTRWRVAGLVGGPVEGGGRVSGYFTGASGVTIYQGHAWPREYLGDAFIGDVGGNLVHHKRLDFDGVVAAARRPDQERDHEFVASPDNWFRPVQFANAPDGCLYIVDMYREVIEHPWSIPASIKRHLDLNSGHDRGRLWRLAPQGFQPPPAPRLGEMTVPDLVKTLGHPNGWHRTTAARLLHQRQNPETPELLRRMWREAEVAQARWQVLHVMAGMNAVTGPILQEALRDTSAEVRVLGVRLCHLGLYGNQEAAGLRQESVLTSMTGDPSPEVRFRLALALADAVEPSRLSAMRELIRRDGKDSWMRAASLYAVSGWQAGKQPGPGADALLRGLILNEGFGQVSWQLDFLERLAVLVGRFAERAAVKSLAHWIADREEVRLASAVAEGLADGLRDAGQPAVVEEMAAWLRPLRARARRVMVDEGAGIADRLAAIGLVGWQLEPELREGIWKLLQDEQAPSLRQAAWSALSRHRTSGGAWVEELLERWDVLPAFVQRDALDLFMREPEATRRLMSALRDGTIDDDLVTASQREQLRNHVDGEMARMALAVFGPAESPAARMEALRPALNLSGDVASGRRVYLERCATCHRMAGEGQVLGPDLETVRDGGKEKLLLAIVDPNREVAPNYVQYDVLTKEGETWSGIIVNETSAAVWIRQAGGVQREVRRADVAGMRSGGTSPMPEGLTEGLSLQEVADLLAFLSGEN